MAAQYLSYSREAMDFEASGITYIFPNQMQPAIELENVRPLPSGHDWRGAGRGHVRSASHGGVSLFNPMAHGPPPPASAAINLLEAARGLTEENVSSQDTSTVTTAPKPPPGIEYYSVSYCVRTHQLVR